MTIAELDTSGSLGGCRSRRGCRRVVSWWRWWVRSTLPIAALLSSGVSSFPCCYGFSSSRNADTTTTAAVRFGATTRLVPTRATTTVAGAATAPIQRRRPFRTGSQQQQQPQPPQQQQQHQVLHGWGGTCVASNRCLGRRGRRESTSGGRSRDFRTALSLSSSSSSSSSSSTSSSPTGSNSPTRKVDRTSTSTNTNHTVLIPIFDFGNDTTIDYIDRLDDVIMGGVSTSNVVNAANASYAKWCGVCRVDGGGFCGFRTNPFRRPLDATGAAGLYVRLRLASDGDASRRVWKLNTRTRPDRGELVYQSVVEFQNPTPKSKSNEGDEEEQGNDISTNITSISSRSDGDDGDTVKASVRGDDDDELWSLVKLPFEEFRLVRGPRMIPDGPPLDVSGGLYQIGMTMSKFKMGTETTVLDDFRDGFFELHIKEIGTYYERDSDRNDDDAAADDDTQVPTTAAQAPVIPAPAGAGTSSSVAVAMPAVPAPPLGRTQVPASTPPPPLVIEALTKEETKKRRPVVLKVLFPILSLFFSEKIQRRKSAMRILTKKRGLSKTQAIWFGTQSRAIGRGGTLGSWARSFARTACILGSDAIRFVVFAVLRLAFVYPAKLMRKTAGFVKQAASSLEENM